MSMVQDLLNREWDPTMLMDVMHGARRLLYTPDDVHTAMYLMARKFKENDVHACADVVHEISDTAILFATEMMYDMVDKRDDDDDRQFGYELAALTLSAVVFITKVHLPRDVRLAKLLNPGVIRSAVLDNPLVKDALALV